MLIFSTKLIVNEKLTREVFLGMIIDWLSENRHYGFGLITYAGELPFELECENDHLEIEEYAEALTVHLTSRSEGVIWTNDYVLTAADEKNILSVQLYSDTESMSVKMPERFNKPRVLGQIVKNGYGGMDQQIPVSDQPYMINEENVDIACGLIMHECEYFMPVVYVTYPRYAIDPQIDFQTLAVNLSGIAHVVVETKEIASTVRRLTNERNPYAGAVQIFYGKHNSIRVLPDNYETLEEMRALIENSVSQKVLMTRMDDRFSWMRIHFKYLQEQNRKEPELISLYEQMLKESESEGELKQQRIDELEYQIMELEEKMSDLRAQIANKDSQIETYRHGFAQSGQNHLMSEQCFKSTEQELYHGEIKDVILKVLEKERNQMDSSQNLCESRKFHVLQDILGQNQVTGIDNEISEALKNILDQSCNLNAQQKRRLLEYGFKIETGKHYKVTFNEDDRYIFTLSKTPGDYRTNLNTLKDAINTLFGR